MAIETYFVLFLSCFAVILACRVVPIFVLKGRELPATLERALNFIPPAAFAALVANDLFNPDTLASGEVYSQVALLVAAAVVIVVGVKSKSMAACIIVGVCALAALTYLPALF